MFKQLPDIYTGTSKYKSLNISNIDAAVLKEGRGKDMEIQLSLSTKEMNGAQSNDTFYSTMVKLIKDKKVSSDKYFMSKHGFKHKVVREDDNLFHALAAPNVFNKYVLHQANDVIGHNGTARIDVLNSYINGNDCIKMLISI